jgi:CubicO group peptidase (beta-lactamase class C family)/peptidoglycan/LPS O-acetylase OafA/YrhL
MTTPTAQATTPRATKPATQREGFLDTIRAIATVRVVFWHAFGTPMLSFVVASMPTMFFVAGSLLGASLDRRDFRAVLRDRLRRLLIPFWLFGAFAISVMAISRAVTGHADTALNLPKLLGWIVPLVDPKGSVWEAGWLSQPLWYLRAFLWLLLAAPMLRCALRRFGNVVFAPSIVVVMATEFFIRHPNAAPPGFTTWRWYTGDFALYSVFLLLGFRHREGAFRSLSTSARIEWGFIAGTCAAIWCATQPMISNVVNNSYPAHFLVGATWLCVFLALEKELAKGPTTPIVGPVIRWLTQRSLTIYLWHTTTIVCAEYLLNRFAPHATRLLVIPIVVVLIPLFAAAVGWAEDLSAGRNARVWPLPLPFTLPSPRISARNVVNVVRIRTTLRQSVRGVDGVNDEGQRTRRNVPSGPRPNGSPLLSGFFGFGTAMALIAIAPLTAASRLGVAPGADPSGETSGIVANRRPPAPSARPDTAVFARPSVPVSPNLANAATTNQLSTPSTQPGNSVPEAELAGGPVTSVVTTRADMPATKPVTTPVASPVATPVTKPAAAQKESTTRLGSAPRWAEMPTAPANKLQTTLDAWMKDLNVSGITVALGRPDGTLWKAGRGTLGPNDQMEITSITKTFTSALTMSLADEGKIALDAPLPALAAVPTFPKGTGITPRQLLQHSSGLSTYQDTPEYLANPGMSLTPAQAVALAAKQKLLWPPGTNSGYSSSGYLTLGILSEQAGGGSYKSQLEKRFFGPLGLTNTMVDETPIAGWIGFSTGGIKSTMADLVTWGAALYRDRTVVSKRASAEIVNVNNDWSVGLGAWPVCPCNLDAAGTKVLTSIGHNGGSGALEYSPADHLVIAAFLTEPIFNSRISQQDLYDLFARLRLAAAS